MELEALAQQAQTITKQYFGRAIGLYAPLYLANYCDNQCVYCGFQASRDIVRTKLSPEQIDQECRQLAATGIQDLLLLTGESRKHTPVSYIKEAIQIAKKYFPNISLEIYPLETEEYRELYEAGADGVTVYQETYDRKRYAELHPAGKKRDYDYRYVAPERIAEAGFRRISIGFLLGLWDWQTDLQALFEHLHYLEKKYPGVEYSVSFPRMRFMDDPGVEHCLHPQYYPVSDRELVEMICRARIEFPRVGINLSTRESAELRDNLLGLGITKISAGSLTTVGGYTKNENLTVETSSTSDSAVQFEVQDERTLKEVTTLLKQKGFDPVMTDWRRITNE